ncbi:beta-microseminoprotein-like isoform X3 [Epinephelus fuscoguttatus]|uniref:beta-microseminoprotein-like isoform X1 n=1 Tax=Epinephelus fuscoguttatus TaxID=293821 RepID=UPI0020D151F1|nr:beta-microseminoprotein-like isoform X1 [Epinephelus fuscoguttatus]XP_049435295.1 beta-microseminoprotein-like isoform X2 [Epinephelus fuscoguttatus]XP_049435296.1 beta-microseminoprotein-like isoform X3 [Epinephelus fuscoguttatus]
MSLTAAMKYLALAFLLCALAPLSNGACHHKVMKPDMTHCQDDVDETWHAVGSSWRNSRCMDCTCSRCCTGFSIPVGFPDYCVKVFDPEACEYIVHKKDDPSVLCPVRGGKGK